MNYNINLSLNWKNMDYKINNILKQISLFIGTISRLQNGINGF